MKCIALATIVLGVMTAAPAIADDLDGVPSVRVSYADLKIDQPAGRAALKRRIGKAIAYVCPAPPATDVGLLEAYRTCRATARDSARRELALAGRR